MRLEYVSRISSLQAAALTLPNTVLESASSIFLRHDHSGGSVDSRSEAESVKNDATGALRWVWWFGDAL